MNIINFHSQTKLIKPEDLKRINSFAYIYSLFLNEKSKKIKDIRINLMDKGLPVSSFNKPMKGYIKHIYVEFDSEKYLTSCGEQKIIQLKEAIIKSVHILATFYEEIDIERYKQAMFHMDNNNNIYCATHGKKVKNEDKTLSIQIYYELEMEMYRLYIKLIEQKTKESKLITIIHSKPSDIHFFALLGALSWVNNNLFLYEIKKGKILHFYGKVESDEIVLFAGDKSSIFELSLNSVNQEERNRLYSEVKIMD